MKKKNIRYSWLNSKFLFMYCEVSGPISLKVSLFINARVKLILYNCLNKYPPFTRLEMVDS